MRIAKKTTLKSGCTIQFEDWGNVFTIGIYPIANGCTWLIHPGERVRFAIDGGQDIVKALYLFDRIVADSNPKELINKILKNKDCFIDWTGRRPDFNGAAIAFDQLTF